MEGRGPILWALDPSRVCACRGPGGLQVSQAGSQWQGINTQIGLTPHEPQMAVGSLGVCKPHSPGKRKLKV